jgi:hypothetical protein
MTAMSAQRASETPSNAESPRDTVASLRTVVVPGSPATYEHRAELKEIGLRWDPLGHRWHGTTTAARVRELRERLGLEVRVFGVLDAATPKGPAAPKPVLPMRPTTSGAASPARDPDRRPHDFSRTRVEARIVFPSLEEPEEIVTPTRRFTVWETTSGLPDDSREADEAAEERRLRDLRARLKRARAIISMSPGLAEILASDSHKAARFYARVGVTEAMFRMGATAGTSAVNNQ